MSHSPLRASSLGCFVLASASFVFLVSLVSAAPPAQANATAPTSEITALLKQQAADWNRGDLDAFASGYKRSADTLFIGRTVEHGYDGMLAGYKARYPTREAMGTLSFSQLAVQLLDGQFATATGHFHLARSAGGGGAADGYFLLVLERTPAGWRIVRDDTTSLPSPSR